MEKVTIEVGSLGLAGRTFEVEGAVKHTAEQFSQPSRRGQALGYPMTTKVERILICLSSPPPARLVELAGEQPRVNVEWNGGTATLGPASLQVWGRHQGPKVSNEVVVQLL